MYADRDRYVADPAFVAVPVNGLLDPAYVDNPLAASPVNEYVCFGETCPLGRVGNFTVRRLSAVASVPLLLSAAPTPTAR